jgi:hypothetical protein
LKPAVIALRFAFLPKCQGDILHFQAAFLDRAANFLLANFISLAPHSWQDNSSLPGGNGPSFPEPKVLGLSQSQKTQVDVVPWFVILRGPETPIAKGLPAVESSLFLQKRAPEKGIAGGFCEGLGFAPFFAREPLPA